MEKIYVRQGQPAQLDVSDLHNKIDGIADHIHKIYAAAMWYADRGIAIVPFYNGAFPGGLSQRHATTKLKTVDLWWHPEKGNYPGANIAMAHGGAAGYCAIDLDDKEGADGIANFADLVSAYGDYGSFESDGVNTLTATTPSGGKHLIFKYHPEINSNAKAHYKGIDTRGGVIGKPHVNGGITFLEPSKSIKGIKGEYRWQDKITQIIDMPTWLVGVMNGRAAPVSGGMKLQDSYLQSAPGTHGEGRDRNIYGDLLRFIGIGYTEEQLWELVPQILERMDPPDEQMINNKIRSALKSEAFIHASKRKDDAAELGTLKLEQDKKGNLLRTVTNLKVIIESSMFEEQYGLIEYDDFTQDLVRNKKSMNSAANWAIGIQLWIAEKFKLEFMPYTIKDTVEYLAIEQKKHTNIAKHYMFSCPRPSIRGEEDFWGSKRRGPGENFERLCVEVLDLDNVSLTMNYTTEMRIAYKAFLWFWMQGVVARACVPGCKMEIVLNIFGDQGIGKSLFLQSLCPDTSWFTDSIQDTIAGGGQNNRDELLKLGGKIIVEMPELSPVKRGGKSGDDKMKHFISAQVDKYRKAYGHSSVDNPRTCALCGTANNNDIYRDSSGARRFVSIDHGIFPIKVGDKDKGVLKQIRDLVWGELVDSFNEGELDGPAEKLFVAIPKELRHAQAMINTEHKFEEVGISEVVDWMKDKTRVTWQEVNLFARSVPGLRDLRERELMDAIKKGLLHEKIFELRKRTTYHREDGSKSITTVWINMALPIERDTLPGFSAPNHWSTYITKEGDQEPEF